MTYRPAVVCAFGLVAGITVQKFLDIPVWMVLMILGVACALSFLRTPLRMISVVLMVAATGYILACVDAMPLKNDIFLLKPSGGDVVLQGVVISDVETKHVLKTRKMVFEVKIEKMIHDGRWMPAGGVVMANVFQDLDVEFGDRLLLKGKIHQPHDAGEQRSSYSDYLDRRGIRYLLSVGRDDDLSVIGRRVFPVWRMMFRDVHRTFGQIFYQHLPESEAGLMRAMMTGDRSGIPSGVKQLFLETGTIHIIAISGFNMVIVAGIFLFGLQCLPMGFRWRMTGGVLMVLAYALVTDGEASIVRAAVMTSVVLISYVLEREQDAYNTLSVSAIIILCCAPWQLFDVGFQLTFMCVWALLAVHPKVFVLFPHISSLAATKVHWLQRLWYAFAESLSLSLSVWIAVAGLIVYYFQMFTPVTLVANLLVVPLAGCLVVLGLLMGLSAVFFPILCPIWSLYVSFCLNGIVALLYMMRSWPGACFYLDQPPSGMFLAVYYGIFAVIFIGLTRFSRSSKGFPEKSHRVAIRQSRWYTFERQ